MGDTMLKLYVLDAVSSEQIPVVVAPAAKQDLAATHDRQMQKLTEDAARRKYADFIENTG